MRTIEARAMSLTFLLALGAAGGCTSDGADDDVTPDSARLEIVGERTLRLENGWSTELRVRYTDGQGQPLAGEIEFSMDGEVGGAFLSDTAAVTDASGEATITLTSGEAGDAAFLVSADAVDTDPVQWDVAVLERALDVTGSYRVTSEFDLASGLPGTAGEVINTFIDMTDDPYDPATWVLDQISQNASGTVRDLIEGARPALDAILNEVLLQTAPDIVGDLVEVGDAFGQIARKFGTGSELRITETNDVDNALLAEHILTELRFTVDGETYPYPLVDMGIQEVTARAPFSYNATRFTIGDHEFPISYGTVLMVALEQIVIPLVDPNAYDLESLLLGYIDCYAIGEAAADYIGLGSADFYAGACELGIEAGASWVEDRIRSLDGSAMVLGIHGGARWIDSNDDYRVDVLQGGTWEGQMSYAGNPAPLGESTFRAERMSSPQ